MKKRIIENDDVVVVDDERWQHFHMKVSTLNYSLIILSTICFLIGILLPLITKIPLPFDNFVDPRYNLTRTKYVPGVRATLEEAVEALNDNNPLHHIYANHVHLRYDYGSSFWNYCKMSKIPSNQYLPSLLRTMELRIDTQYWIRTSVLAIFMCKIFLSYVRVRQLMMFSDNKLFHSFSIIIPFLEFIHLTFAILILCLQQDQDKSLIWMMEMLIPLFGISFISYSFCYTILDSFDSYKKDTYTMHFRFICLLSFTSTIFSVHDSHMKYLAWKACHSLIPIHEALLEYICICSLIFFHLSQIYDFHNLHIFTSSTVVEQNTFSLDDTFEPAFIKSLAPKQTTDIIFTNSICHF